MNFLGNFLRFGFVSLESLSQKFEENIANQRGDHRDFKLAAVKTSVIAHDALFLTHARAFEFAHEEVGVKQEDECDFD